MSGEVVSPAGGASAAAVVPVKSSHPLFKWIGSLHSSEKSRRGSYLPLPVSVEKIRSEAVRDVLIDIHQHSLMNLHFCQKNLQFWRSRVQYEEYKIVQEGPFFRYHEPFFEAGNPEDEDKVYKAIDEFTSLDESLKLMEKIHGYLVDLAVSMKEVTGQEHSFSDDPVEALVPHSAAEDLIGYISFIKANFLILDERMSSVVCKYAKPKTLKESWQPYVAGAVTVSILSIWLVSYFRNPGLFDNFMVNLSGALRSQIESLFVSIRNESLTAPMRAEVMKLEHVQASQDHLKRMLLNFGETRQQKFPEVIDEQKAELMLFEIFNKQLKNPLKTLLSGDILSALIIQAQMIKSLAVTRLELYERIWADGFRLVLFRVLPAVSVSVGLLLISREWSKQRKSTSRRLLCEAGKRIEQYLEVKLKEGNNNDIDFLHGLVLYTLDSFYNYTEKEARAKKEWESLREDVVAIGNVQSKVEYDRLMNRILTTYECL